MRRRKMVANRSSWRNHDDDVDDDDDNDEDDNTDDDGNDGDGNHIWNPFAKNNVSKNGQAVTVGFDDDVD